MDLAEFREYILWSTCVFLPNAAYSRRVFFSLIFNEFLK